MAFEKKFNYTQKEMCPVCRREYTCGKRPLHTAYSQGVMCDDCFERIYKNRAGKRTAGYSDDASNLLTRFRPASILEKPLLFKKKYPTGYEYAMPEVTEKGLLLKMAVWLFMAGMIWLMMKIISWTDIAIPETFLCLVAGNAVTAAGSAILALQNIIILLKGLFLGMGIPRRLILLAEIAVLVFLAVRNISPVIHFLT